MSGDGIQFSFNYRPKYRPAAQILVLRDDHDRPTKALVLAGERLNHGDRIAIQRAGGPTLGTVFERVGVLRFQSDDGRVAIDELPGDGSVWAARLWPQSEAK